MTLLQRVCLCCVALFTAACFEPASQRCASGVVCPEGFQCTADGRQCVRVGDSCGNGVKEAGEACDDGNRNNYDGCRADCRGLGICGDLIVDSDLLGDDGLPLEVCDDGNTRSGDGCSADCRSTEACGNGITDEGEDCDDWKDGGHDCNVECRWKRCGDNRLDTRFDGGNEVCDRGDTIDGDGCSADCRSNETCGNGIVDTAVGEECDGQPDCNGACRWKRCGDGVADTYVDGGQEQCDDGDPDGGSNANGGAWCSEVCRLKLCGNGIRDERAAWDGGIRSEECDDGNTIETDGCNNVCLIPRCGNGYRDPGELCDDGNQVSGDGCRGDCLGLELCGDNHRDLVLKDGGSEACDDGNTDSADGCRADCQGIEVCGDGRLDPVLLDGGAEVCDDHNTQGGDGCRADCLGTELCGDWLVDPVLMDGGAEACDDGNRDGGDGCRADCRGVEVCGDGLVDPVLLDGGFEICDPPNASCASDCRTRGECGNGLLEPHLDEECDDGNVDDNDGCTSACKLAICGDLIIRTVGTQLEQCDDGHETFDCNANCTNARCGDGVINATRLEECDVLNPDGGTSRETSACDTDCTAAWCGDGTRNATRGEACDTAGFSQTCNADCTLSTCGDGKRNPSAVPPEQCDDGPANTAGCNSNCTYARCGDGFFNSAAGEQCDDGNTFDDDGCVTGCRVNVCGDGFRNVRDAGYEACDDGNTTTEASCAYGVPVCTGCNATCSAVLNLTGPYCGDTIHQADAGEACDDGNTINETNCAYGLTSCPGCSSDCRAGYSLMGTLYCGNAVRDLQPDGGLEPCDDGNTDTETACPYGPGTCTACSGDCQTVLSLSGPRCGDGTRQADAGEACDDGNTTNETSCSYGQTSCPGCSSDCRTSYVLQGTRYCGNGVRDTQADGGLEPCDDGNTDTETACPYGVASCTACSGNCQTVLSLTGPRCGDGTRQADAGEACDDGNTVTETACDYGTPTCTKCDATCTATLSLTGNVCGDGVVAPGFEQCDDNNTLACGTCNADCTASRPPIEATGNINTIGATNLLDGETFTLNDGSNPARVFCFSKPATLADGGVGTSACTGTQIAVNVSAATGAQSVADAIVSAINSTPALNITAVKRTANPWVRLVNDLVGGLGNVAITETVANSGFVASGMSGGGARDCAAGVRCSVGNDCVSGGCDAGLCTP